MVHFEKQKNHGGKIMKNLFYITYILLIAGLIALFPGMLLQIKALRSLGFICFGIVIILLIIKNIYDAWKSI